jgi:LPXTG-motif cell wall-anchored protein
MDDNRSYDTREVSMKRNDSRLLAGLILFVIGAAGFAYGLITYNNGRASLDSALQRVFKGNSSIEQQATIIMIAGGAVALIGLILLLVRRRRR